MTDPSMNKFNEKMLEDTLNNFNVMYSIYSDNIDTISKIDTAKPFEDMLCLVGDITRCNSQLGKEAMCKALSELVTKTSDDVSRLKEVIDSMGKKFIAIRNKMPLPKSEVDKILKIFNFYDYDRDSTTTGNLLDYRCRDLAIGKDSSGDCTKDFMRYIGDLAADGCTAATPEAPEKHGHARAGKASKTDAPASGKKAKRSGSKKSK